MPHRKKSIAFIAAMVIVIAAPLAVIATDAFTDVPESNVHHDDIAWLKDAGVTAGCNPPTNTEYCPGDPVLRQQMASFMRRLAENQVVDAGQLGGVEPSGYRTVVAADIDGNLTGTGMNSGDTELNAVEITAPADGILVVSGSAAISNNTGGDALFGLRPAVDGTVVQGAAGNATFVQLAATEVEALAYTVAFEVTAGTHTVTQSASALHPILGGPIAGNFFYNANQLTVTWHPEGTITLSPASDGDGSFSGS